MAESKPPLDSAPQEPPPQPGTREQLVSTAVKFLQNPKVRLSTLDQKMFFLKKKGLTDEEIQVACEKSGTLVDEQTKPTQPLQHTLVPIPSQSLQPYPTFTSPWIKIRDYCNAILVIGGASYGLYYLYKTYIVPYLFGEPKRKKQKSVEEMVEELNTSVCQMLQQLQETLNVLQATLKQHQRKLEELSQQQGLGAGSKEILQDLKTELASVKGLLLNRHQFPAVPTPSPAIPVWQLGHRMKNSPSQSSMKENTAEVSSVETSTVPVEKAPDACEEEGKEVKISQEERMCSEKHASRDSSNGINSSGSSELIIVNEPNSEGSDTSIEAEKEFCTVERDSKFDIKKQLST